MKKALKIAGFVVAAIIVLGSLVGDTDDEPVSEAQAEPTVAAVVETETATEEAQTVESRCETVPQEVIDDIISGLEPDSITLTSGAAVKSESYANVWMIAAQMEGPGLDDNTVGVWSTNSLDEGSRVITAVDAMADTFSVWPQKGSNGDDGVDEAKACL